MSHERPAGPVALTADELEGPELEGPELEGAELGDRDTPLPPTDPEPKPNTAPTDAPPPLEQAAAVDPAAAIMISAPQRPAVAMGFFPTTGPPQPMQGAASGFWPRK